MSYIKLDEVTENHLVGSWKVTHRLTSNTNVSELFARCDRIKFSPEQHFLAVTQDGKRKKGSWEITREKDMIYNPQVKFHLAKKTLVNSIITNLVTEEDSYCKLILYFDSGIELVLEKELKKAVASSSKAA